VRNFEVPLLDRVASLTSLAPGTACSHLTAAALWGIFLPPWLDPADPIHLSRPLELTAPRRPGVLGHRAPFTRCDVVEVRGAFLTSPAWTWTDLAEMLALADLVAAGDCLLRREDAPPRPGELHFPDPLCTITEIADVVARRPGTRGIRRARTALELLRSGVDSAPESRLRLHILDAGLPEPEVNRWIVDALGRRVSRPDLQYRRQRIALEYEGEHHLLDAAQCTRDIERDDRLRALGWTVLRFTKAHLVPGSVPFAMAKIRSALAAADPASKVH
jgi:very-short-patch-repair endonuclease